MLANVNACDLYINVIAMLQLKGPLMTGGQWGKQVAERRTEGRRRRMGG